MSNVFMSRTMLKRLANVTHEDLKRVGNEYFPALFDYERSSCVVCCNPGKVDEIRKGLSRWVY